MGLKNLLKRKKDKFPRDQAPRDLSEIKAEYSRVAAQAGGLQYEIAVKSDGLKQLNEQLRQINNEAAARLKLDEHVKQQEHLAKGVKNEQA